MIFLLCVKTIGGTGITKHLSLKRTQFRETRRYFRQQKAIAEYFEELIETVQKNHVHFIMKYGYGGNSLFSTISTRTFETPSKNRRHCQRTTNFLF